MSLEWLKSISARIGIEGRNTVIVAGLAFCGFGLWLFLRTYDDHPILSFAFLAAFFLLGAAAILIGLLRKPQPSEVSDKFLYQQIGRQVIYAGGLQSLPELVELLRTAHNVQPLPPPSAIVTGAAADEASYRLISEPEAQELALKDREGVQQNLLREVERIQSLLNISTVAGGALRHVSGPPPEKQPSKDSGDSQLGPASTNERPTPKDLPEGKP